MLDPDCVVTDFSEVLLKFILWQKGAWLPYPASCLHPGLWSQEAEAVEMFMLENTVFAAHDLEFLKLEKCAYCLPL